MTAKYISIQRSLLMEPKAWLVTGAAGFIGSNLLETLLKLNQRVVGLDNFSTGYQHNLDEVRASVTTDQWSNFKFIEGDIRELSVCKTTVQNINYVLHHAALGSVPRSIEDPISVNANNIDGFLNMLVAARDAKVDRFVYAASSSTYGDHPGLPKKEEEIGRPLSPYAVTKLVNEIYADVFSQVYNFDSIGLRYFNIFGCRQDPEGSYAAVIPKWVSSMIHSEEIYINGDGETSRDFCYIDNVVQANLLAATCEDQAVVNQVYNVGLGIQCSLNELYGLIRNSLVSDYSYLKNAKPVHRDFVVGDVRHSIADISKIEKSLGYKPTHDVNKGLLETVAWYVAQNIESNEA